MTGPKVDSVPETGFRARKRIRGPNGEQDETKRIRIGYEKVSKAKGNSRKHNEIDLRYDEVSLTVDSGPETGFGFGARMENRRKLRE